MKLAAVVLFGIGCLVSSSSAWAASPREALQAIAKAEDERRFADGELSGALHSGSAAVRARAARAIGRIQDSTSVHVLSAALFDSDVQVRREAAFALGQVGHRSAREALERAMGDRDPQVVESAIEALGKLGDHASTAKVAGFLTAKLPGQRAEAAVALWRLADSTAIPNLLARLDEADPAVRWRVVYALEKTVAPERIVPAVRQLLQDPDPLVRAHAARTLGRQKSPLAVEALITAVRDGDAPVVVNAIRALQSIADSTQGGQLPALEWALRAHRDPYVRVTAATALAEPFAWKFGTPSEVQFARGTLHAGVTDRDAATRGACGRAILMREGMGVLLGVQPLFSDSVVYVRVAMLDAFRNLPPADYTSTPPRVANALQQSLAPTRPLLERMTAAELVGVLIGRLHQPVYSALLTNLRSGLDDKDVLMAAACAGALAEAGDTISVAALARSYAARGRDADADARISIRDALRTLAGTGFADSVERANPIPALAAPSSADATGRRPARRAVIITSEGVMEWALEHEQAPRTVQNFVALARKGYFDGLVVHRVVPDFVIQDGDPTGTGSGGPGYTIRCEYNPLRYDSGMVGMALSGKDTGGSQWFVTLAPQPHLNGRYTIFARVTRGLDVARRITQGSRIVRVEPRP